MARQLRGIASWGDRFRLLSAIDEAAPEVRRDLAALLSPEREKLLAGLRSAERLLIENRDVANGAFPAEPRDWPLGNVGQVAALNDAISAWASRWNINAPWVLLTAALTLHRWATRGTSLTRSHFEALPWANYIPTSNKNLGARPLQEHTQLSTRQKHALGVGIETLGLRTDTHLLAFVRWQVLGVGAERVAQQWGAGARPG